MQTSGPIIPDDLIHAYYRALHLVGLANNADEIAVAEILRIVDMQPPYTTEDLGIRNEYQFPRSDPQDVRLMMMSVFQRQVKDREEV